MTSEDFVQLFRQEKSEAISTYRSVQAGSAVAAQIAAMGLNATQLDQMHAVINTALTDTYYTILLALDGCTSLGGVQQNYVVKDASGDTVCCGDGELEALAFEYFHGSKSTSHKFGEGSMSLTHKNSDTPPNVN